MKAIKLKLIHALASTWNEHNSMNDASTPACTLSRRDVRSIIFHLLYALESLDYESSVQSVAIGFNHEYDTCIPLEGEIVDTVQAVATKRIELDEFVFFS